MRNRTENERHREKKAREAEGKPAPKPRKPKANFLNTALRDALIDAQNNRRNDHVR